jgi:hypothetical protein
MRFDHGLIRKSLAVGTLGVVNGSSKKQRVAKAAMNNTAAMAATAAAANRAAEQRAAEEREFRYATDPVYRKFIDDKAAAAAAAQRALVAQRAETSRRRRARAKKALALTGRGIAIGVVAITVWAPQIVVGKVRRKPADKWMYPRLVGRSGAVPKQLTR